MNTNSLSSLLGPAFQAVATDGDLALRQLALPPDAAVLDVGTGKGNFAIYLASLGFRVLTGEPATDTSLYARRDWASNAARAGLGDRITFQSFTAGNLPFPARSFDAVFFFGVLHHIDEPLRREVLRQALRVVKEHQPVVFFEPRPEMLQRIWAEDPHHPLAADPSQYLPDQPLAQQRIEGSLMDIFIFRECGN